MQFALCKLALPQAWMQVVCLNGGARHELGRIATTSPRCFFEHILQGVRSRSISYKHQIDNEFNRGIAVRNLGRRYERLMLLTAPMTFATGLLLFVAMALNNQQEIVRANCLNEGAYALEKNTDVVNKWERAKPVNKNSLWGIEYKTALQVAITQGVPRLLPSGITEDSCRTYLEGLVESRFRSAPEEIIARFRHEARSVTNAPFEFHGIELPEKASVSLIGTTVRFRWSQFCLLLVAVLGPLMMLWYASIYQTRYRETLLISKAKGVWEVFPHSVNNYPAIKVPTFRKKTFGARQVPLMNALLAFVYRIMVVSICTGPPSVAYLMSLFYLGSIENYTFFLYAAVGTLVGFFSIGPIFVELMPWHFMKTFPAEITVDSYRA